MNPRWAALFEGFAGYVNQGPWPDSPATVPLATSSGGDHVLENGFSRFRSLVGSSRDSVDIGQSTHAPLSFALFTELSVHQLAHGARIVGKRQS
jgi:hypothetical protein